MCATATCSTARSCVPSALADVPEVLIYNNGRLARKINNPNTIRQEINKLYP